MHFKRQELKYYLSEIQSQSLLHQLSQLMAFDSNSEGSRGYVVRSLYFDSIDDECLYQKQSGLLYRQKIRLRTYGDSRNGVCGVAKFEIKQKHGQLVNKDSVSIDLEDARQICRGEYGLLLKPDNPVLNKIYTIFSTRVYKPKVIVEYNRVALSLPVANIRVTFDQNLRSNVNQLELFEPSRSSMPVIVEGKQILEVKFDEYFPGFLKRVLSGYSAERMAISKYTLARRYFKVNKWEDN